MQVLDEKRDAILSIIQKQKQNQHQSRNIMDINNNNQVKKIRIKMRHDTQSSFKTGTVQSVSPKRYLETISSY